MTLKKKASQPARKLPRQTQLQRRAAMRKRILEATLDCLAKYGYAGTGVTQVVARARVSRGAWSHHFPSMNALIVEAAEYLLNQVYERLASATLKVTQQKDPVRALVYTVWQEFFDSPVNEIYLELLIASRRNPQLARKLRTLAATLEGRVGSAADLFFQSAPDSPVSVAQMLHFNRWVLRGIALDAPLMPKGGVERALDALSRVLSAQIRNKSAGA